MHKEVKYLFLTIICCFSFWGKAQDFAAPETRDSLIKIVTERVHHDTVIIENCLYLGHWYIYNQPDSAEYYVREGIKVADSIQHIEGLMGCYGMLSNINANRGNYPLAIDYNLQALNLAKSHGLDVKQNYVILLNNQGNLHTKGGNNEQALAYFIECSKRNAETGNEKSLSTNYHNMGLAYRNLKQLDTAAYYYRKAIAIREGIDYPVGLAYSYRGLGDVFFNMGMMDSVNVYYERALKISRANGYKRSLAASCYKLGRVLLEEGNLAEAKQYALESYQTADAYGFSYEKSEAAKVLFQVYKASGQYNQALGYFEIHTEIKDSLNSIENQRKVIESGFKYEYDKKRIVDSLEQEKVLISAQLLEEENKVKAGQIWVQRLGLVVLLLCIGLLITSLLFVRRKNQIKMDQLRSEVRLRLSETVALKNKLNEQVKLAQSKENSIADINVILQDKLTEREQEVLDGLVMGLSNREIGEKLFLSVNTIKTHINNLYVKLDVNNRTQAAIKGSMLKINNK